MPNGLLCILISGARSLEEKLIFYSEISSDVSTSLLLLNSCFIYTIWSSFLHIACNNLWELLDEHYLNDLNELV